MNARSGQGTGTSCGPLLTLGRTLHRCLQQPVPRAAEVLCLSLGGSCLGQDGGIDQALQRFPVNLKSKIHVVFVARWSGTMSWRGNSSTPPEEVTRIVERITSDWQHDFNYSIGRVNSGFSKRTDPNSARAILRDIRESNTRAVLVVPIDHVSEQIDSAYRLDVVLRNVATEEGISHFKVASAVNCHPNFV